MELLQSVRGKAVLLGTNENKHVFREGTLVHKVYFTAI